MCTFENAPDVRPAENDLRLVGLSGLTPAAWRDLTRHALEEGSLFQGYAGRYRYLCLGEAELSFALMPDSPEETPETASRLTGCDVNARSDIFLTMIVEDAPEIERTSPMSRCLLMRPKKGEKRLPVPAHIMHADVLPSLSPGDRVRLQVVILSDQPGYHSPAPEEDLTDGEIIPLRELPELAAGVENPEEKVFVAGQVLSVEEVEPDGSPFGPAETAIRARIRTAIGPLMVFHPLSLVKEEDRRHLSPGCVGRFIGKFSGDAAVEEYQLGAVYDLEHDLRLLSECLRRRCFDRAGNIFSVEAKYFSNGSLRAEGRDQIVGSLNATARNLIETGYDLGSCYASVAPLEGQDTGRHTDGEKCLALLTPDGEGHSLLFADTDEEGKIVSLSVEYDCPFSFFRFPSFEKWRHPEGDPRERESDENEQDFFSRADVLARTSGDPRSFFAPPSESFLDILSYGLFLGTEKLRTIIAESVFPEEDGRAGAGGGVTRSAMYYPDRESEARLLSLIRPDSEKKGMLLLSMLPVLPGHVNRLTIDAVYGWSDGLNGEVACNGGKGGGQLSFHIPFYFRDREALQPGSCVDISLYGMALDLTIEHREPFTVTKGPIYELSLKEFLEENPDLEEKDFEPPLIYTDGAFFAFPGESSCRMSLETPVLEVSRISFLGAGFFRLLIPVSRDINGEEEDVLACLYVHEEMLEGSEIKAGDDISCLVWLAGCLVPEN